MKPLPVAVMLAALFVLAPIAENGAASERLSSVAGPGASPLIGRRPDLAWLRPVRSRCDFDCRICRDVCYGTWRLRCRGPGCRGEFTLCMRACWERICRWCP